MGALAAKVEDAKTPMPKKAEGNKKGTPATGTKEEKVQAEVIRLKEKTYKVEPKNWVGAASQKGKPMNPKTVKGILDAYPEQKYLKVQNSYYTLDLSLGDDGQLLAKVNKTGEVKGKVVGWYNKANQERKKKLGVYNVCRSLREVIAKENKLGNPNLVQVLIEV